jgi:hypothetical protein
MGEGHMPPLEEDAATERIQQHSQVTCPHHPHQHHHHPNPVHLQQAASLYNSYEQLRLGWIPSDASLTGNGIIPVPYQ